MNQLTAQIGFVLLLALLVIGYVGWYTSYDKCKGFEEALVIMFENDISYKVGPEGLTDSTGTIDYYDLQGRHIVGGYGYEGYYYVPPFWKMDSFAAAGKEGPNAENKGKRCKDIRQARHQVRSGHGTGAQGREDNGAG